MTDDRRRKPQGSSGWTPRDLGLSTARVGITALAMAGGLGNLAGRLPGERRANRYPRPVQGRRRAAPEDAPAGATRPQADTPDKLTRASSSDAPNTTKKEGKSS